MIPIERVENKIIIMRGEKVMLDADLAELYGVTNKQLNQAVTRNIDRFPEDFAFTLTKQGMDNLKFQFGTSSWGGVRKPPRAFTEQGVAMLSGVLKSKQAVQVNILIMRAFVKMREVISSHAELARKIDSIERKYDAQFKVVFDAIRQLMAPPAAAKKRFGFQTGKDESGKKVEGRKR
jgi:hypothetical protein